MTLRVMFDNLCGYSGEVSCFIIIHLYSPKYTVINSFVMEVVSGYNWGQWSPLTSALAHKVIIYKLDYANGLS